MSRDRGSRSLYRVDSNYDLLKFLDRGEAAASQNRWTFEIAWEVANKSKSSEFRIFLNGSCRRLLLLQLSSSIFVFERM